MYITFEVPKNDLLVQDKESDDEESPNEEKEFELYRLKQFYSIALYRGFYKFINKGCVLKVYNRYMKDRYSRKSVGNEIIVYTVCVFKRGKTYTFYINSSKIDPEIFICDVLLPETSCEHDPSEFH